MNPQEIAEQIAYWLLEEDFLTDQQMMDRFQIDDFELIKAKNILCRYHGVAFERPQNLGELTMPVLMLSPEYREEGGREMLGRVFHDPSYRTRKRAREIERKQSLRGEVKEMLEALQEEMGITLNDLKSDSENG